MRFRYCMNSNVQSSLAHFWIIGFGSCGAIEDMFNRLFIFF